MYTVYILRSILNKRYYIGSTSNLELRLRQHNAGKTKSLLKYLPVKVIYSEIYKTQLEAVRRELQIKSYKGGEAFKRLITK